MPLRAVVEEDLLALVLDEGDEADEEEDGGSNVPKVVLDLRGAKKERGRVVRGREKERGEEGRKTRGVGVCVRAHASCPRRRRSSSVVKIVAERGQHKREEKKNQTHLVLDLVANVAEERAEDVNLKGAELLDALVARVLRRAGREGDHTTKEREVLCVRGGCNICRPSQRSRARARGGQSAGTHGIALPQLQNEASERGGTERAKMCAAEASEGVCE